MDPDVQEAGRHRHMEVRTDDKQLLVWRKSSVLGLSVTAKLEVDRIERPELGVDPENLVRAELSSIDPIQFGGTAGRIICRFVGIGKQDVNVEEV